MKKVLKIILIFLIGSIGYGAIEIAFRGFTHWSMVLTGGACLLSLYYINLSIKDAPIALKALIGAVIITVYELSVGTMVNKWFGLNVWDYSALQGNYKGLICPLFSFIWFFLCFFLASLWVFFYNKYGKKNGQAEDELYAEQVEAEKFSGLTM